MQDDAYFVSDTFRAKAGYEYIVTVTAQNARIYYVEFLYPGQNPQYDVGTKSQRNEASHTQLRDHVTFGWTAPRNLDAVNYRVVFLNRNDESKSVATLFEANPVEFEP